MSSPWGMDLSYMWIAEIRRKNFFPVIVQDFWNLSCRCLLSWILVNLDRMFLLEKIWPSNIWLTLQGNYPLNLLPPYFPCWNELIQISWFNQENTVAVKSWRFLHWTRKFLHSTMTMDLPWPFKDFLLRVCRHRWVCGDLPMWRFYCFPRNHWYQGPSSSGNPRNHHIPS